MNGIPNEIEAWLVVNGSCDDQIRVQSILAFNQRPPSSDAFSGRRRCFTNGTQWSSVVFSCFEFLLTSVVAVADVDFVTVSVVGGIADR